jgi:two-component system phosphate regulon response regulator OmpR
MPSPPRQKVLVVDDDLRLRDLLKRYLTEQGFAVDTVPDGTAMDRQMQRMRYDLVVLDLMLPGEDGLAICRRLRARRQRHPGGDAHGEGRRRGPHPRARDGSRRLPRQALQPARAGRSHQRGASPPARARDARRPATEERVVDFGPYSLNLAQRSLSRDGENVPLTTGEFSLLKALASHPREPMSRDKLMELARGREHESYDRSIDVQVSRLRRLLGEDPQSPRYIQTVWGFGYVFVPDGGAAK